jgi:hypothetical protein
MIQTQTFEFKDTKEDIAVISYALDLLMHKRYDEATKVLIKRHDELTKKPVLKLYGT